jgi:hypothetical protein
MNIIKGVVNTGNDFIRDGKVLSRVIERFGKFHGAYKGAAEGLAWEVLAHAALHGDPALFNKFFGVLDGTWATRLGTWAGEVTRSPLYSTPDPDTEKVKSWLTFNKGSFAVREKSQAQRHAWLDAVKADADRKGFLAPAADGEKIAAAFGDAAVIEALQKLAKKAGKDSAEVSGEVVRIVEEALAKAQRAARVEA